MLRDDIRTALATPGRKTIGSPKATIKIETKYANDYEGKVITESTVKVVKRQEFTVQGPRVNSNDMSSDLDEILSNDPDLESLLDELEPDDE